MKKNPILAAIALLTSLILFSCVSITENSDQEKTTQIKPETMQQRVNEYTKVKLTTDLAKLTDREKKIIPVLINAAKIMDTLFASDIRKPG